MKQPKDTEYFHYYNANPKNKKTDDCVVRAICTALEQPYIDTYREMFEMSIKTGYVINCKELTDKYLASKGWVKHRAPKKWDNKKFTGVEFCEIMQEREWAFPTRIVANIGALHMVAIVKGVIQDIWNSSYGCIGNYWAAN